MLIALLASCTSVVWVRSGVTKLVVVAVGVVSSGTIHRPVVIHLLPSSTSCPRYRISTPIPNLVNETSHPASHSFTTEMSEYEARPGMM